MAGRDKPVEMAVSRFHGRYVVLDLGLKSTQPRRQSTEVEVAPQAAGTKKATQESASSEDSIQLLALFLQEFALCFAHLQRSCVAKIPEVMEMIVETFQLRQDRPQIAGALRNLTLTGRFDRLANASEWATLSTPETRSARSTPRSGVRPSKRFSMPRCLKKSRG